MHGEDSPQNPRMDDGVSDDLRGLVAESGPTRRKFLGVSAALGVAAAVGGVSRGASASEPSESGAPEAQPGDATGMSVAVMVFDRITQLDATAPIEVFAKAGWTVFTVAPERRLVRAGSGLKIMPDYDYESAPEADVLCVPGGGGVNPLLTDAATLDYVRAAASTATYVTSVCTGALILGAAGLLKGKRATTHWASHHFLKSLGAIPVKERVVVDGNLITGGGVTAGVDFAFTVLDEVLGRDAAALVMLALEYDPAPPFVGGVPGNTAEGIVESYGAAAAGSLDQRGKQVEAAAAALAV
ncbi:DJ-1/PfpI family protein [Congregibacter sp.]|uniref:DJ-1/PfpI family protein n=1 Tax=Congregibacter sp. TaxID=2744308 RepID=UPI00385D26F8